MPSISELTLDNWRKPESDHEEQKIGNALDMIKSAINNHPILKTKNIEFVPQGSYCNNTNVRLASDVDICAMLKDAFYDVYRPGVSRADYGFIDGTNRYSDYKAHIIESLQNKFGAQDVRPGNKAIYIESNTYRVHADVVPAFQFRNYAQDFNNNPGNFVEGIKFFSSEGFEIISYPKEHNANGVAKNTKTLRRFKRAVRLYKRIKAKLAEDGIPVSDNIRSFLLEGLLFNVEDSVYINAASWNDLLRSTIISLYNATKTDEGCNQWKEVSGYLPLFGLGRKWTREDVTQFLLQMWNYLEYK